MLVDLFGGSQLGYRAQAVCSNGILVLLQNYFTFFHLPGKQLFSFWLSYVTIWLYLAPDWATRQANQISNCIKAKLFILKIRPTNLLQPQLEIH